MQYEFWLETNLHLYVICALLMASADHLGKITLWLDACYSMERASQLQRSDIHRAMGLSGRQDRRIEGRLLVHGLSPLPLS